ncbi:MAG: hypothetical protein K8E24_005420 [Methanobacterium paludis]|nr:hypothetical protein [Methanobacterium paludis]
MYRLKHKEKYTLKRGAKRTWLMVKVNLRTKLWMIYQVIKGNVQGVLVENDAIR